METKIRVFTMLIVSLLLAVTIVSAAETATCVPVEKQGMFSCLLSGKGFSCMPKYNCPTGTVAQECAGCNGVCCVASTKPNPSVCTMDYNPVCCLVNGQLKNTGNSCSCTNLGGTVSKTGKCEEPSPVPAPVPNPSPNKECTLDSDCTLKCQNDIKCISNIQCNEGKCIYHGTIKACQSEEAQVSINTHNFCVPSNLNDALLKIMKAIGREI